MFIMELLDSFFVCVWGRERESEGKILIFYETYNIGSPEWERDITVKKIFFDTNILKYFIKMKMFMFSFIKIV